MKAKSYEEILAETGVLCWKTVGGSMRPMIREGKDVIVIRKLQAQLKKGDVVLFRRDGVTGRGTYVLHRILGVNDDGSYWIVGDNCFTGETVTRENILGILTEMVRGGNHISLDSPWYKIYVHLWCDCWPVRCCIVRCNRYLGRVIRIIGK